MATPAAVVGLGFDARPPVSTKRIIALYGAVYFLIYFAQKFGNPIEGFPYWVLQVVLGRTPEEGGFGQTPDQIGAFMTMATLPWFIKSFFGVITDAIPIFGYRRKGWLVLASVLSAVGLLVVAMDKSPSQTFLLVTAVVASLGFAFADVICDGLMVETSQDLEARGGLAIGTVNRRFQSLQWMGAFSALAIGAIAGGVVSAYFTLQLAAGISFLFPLAVVVLVIFGIREERRAWNWAQVRPGLVAFVVAGVFLVYVVGTGQIPAGTWWDKVKPYQSYLNGVLTISIMCWFVKPTRALIVPMIFIFCWQAIPFNTDSPASLQYWSKHNSEFLMSLQSGTDSFMAGVRSLVGSLHLAKPEDLALVPDLATKENLAKAQAFAEFYYSSFLQTVSYIVAFCMLFVYTKRWISTPFTKVFSWCCAGAGAYLVWFLALVRWPSLATPASVLLAYGFAGAIGIVAQMAALTYVPPLCKRGNEAASFALFMSLFNLGVALGNKNVGAKIYTSVAQVADGKAAQPHSGMATVLGVSILYVAGVFLFARYAAKKQAAITSEA